MLLTHQNRKIDKKKLEEFIAAINSSTTIFPIPSVLMERLQEPINHCFFEEHLEQELAITNSLRFSTSPELEERMPFLQMLQSVEYPPQLMPMKDTNFQTLLRLQHLKKPWEFGNVYMPEMENQIHGLEFESCITHDIVESHSPIKSEARYFEHPQHSIASVPEVLSGESKQEHPSSVENKDSKQTFYLKSPPSSRETRKRKRTRPAKNKEEVESQRMTHIAVERNRRRLMNDHLNVLKALMPTSYIQRGDQASIVGGAIDFVKGLEQLLKSLESQKKMRRSEGNNDGENSVSSSSSSGLVTISTNGLFMSRSQCKIGGDEENCSNIENEQLTSQNKSKIADIEVTVIQSHVNLKIHCLRRHGQLLKVIVALEELRLTILHLNITSSEHTVFYSFNLKIEEGCKLRSADEIAEAVHQMFRLIEGS